MSTVMAHLDQLIKTYDGSLLPQTCKSLIDIFESNEDKHEFVDREKKPCFTQFNLTENSSLCKSLHDQLITKTRKYRDEYYEFVDERVFPDQHAFEQFRIKRYNPGGDERFDTHVDVIDHPTARRFLSFMWYLNDVDEGGLTVFDDLSVKPQTGKLIIFPPLWMFPHRGEPPVSNPKYILSTYLHYK
jgi:hypothetical protein